MGMTKREQYIRIKNEYRKEHENAPASTRTMLDWAIRVGLYAIDQSAALRKNAEEFADVLRTETVKDDDGQEVRVNHAYGTEQGHFWDDYRTIAHQNMVLSVAQMRNRIYGEIRHSARSIKAYTEFHPDRPRIQTSFNFNNDLEEDGLLTPSSSELDQLIAPQPSVPNASVSRDALFRHSS